MYFLFRILSRIKLQLKWFNPLRSWTQTSKAPIRVKQFLSIHSLWFCRDLMDQILLSCGPKVHCHNDPLRRKTRNFERFTGLYALHKNVLDFQNACKTQKNGLNCSDTKLETSSHTQKMCNPWSIWENNDVREKIHLAFYTSTQNIDYECAGRQKNST